MLRRRLQQNSIISTRRLSMSPGRMFSPKRQKTNPRFDYRRNSQKLRIHDRLGVHKQRQIHLSPINIIKKQTIQTNGINIPRSTHKLIQTPPSPFRVPKSQNVKKMTIKQSNVDKRQSRGSNQRVVWNKYNINAEISLLAEQFLKSGKSLPIIQTPQVSSGKTWPTNIPLYFITIKPDRQAAFLRRFGKDFKPEKTSSSSSSSSSSPLKPQSQPQSHPPQSTQKIIPIPWQGVNGKILDVNKLTRERKLMNPSLIKGEIGCYFSHMKLWEKIVSDKTPLTIICEDDVNLTANPTQAEYLNQILTETKNVPFDILFLSWFRFDGGRFVTQHTKDQWTFCQLWAYAITLEGAKKLLADEKVRNMYEPVDVALWSSCVRKRVRNLVVYPPLCLTVGESSDTANLK